MPRGRFDFEPGGEVRLSTWNVQPTLPRQPWDQAPYATSGKFQLWVAWGKTLGSFQVTSCMLHTTLGTSATSTCGTIGLTGLTFAKLPWKPSFFQSVSLAKLVLFSFVAQCEEGRILSKGGFCPEVHQVERWSCVPSTSFQAEHWHKVACRCEVFESWEGEQGAG